MADVIAGRRSRRRAWRSTTSIRIEDGFEGMTGLRTVRTSVNRQPAVAFGYWRDQESGCLPLTIDVLRVTGGATPR
ncbi:hypothetical protein ACWF9B_03220 [Streptomyces sp. NPDC055089]